jgi:hypothetical protein
MSDEARRNELTLDLKKRGRGGESVRELEDWTDGKKRGQSLPEAVGRFRDLVVWNRDALDNLARPAEKAVRRWHTRLKRERG